MTKPPDRITLSGRPRQPGKRRRRTPEHDLQVECIRWAREAEREHPELALLFAIPNGGSRHVAEAQRLRLAGVRAGVPDLFLPVARHGQHGLFVELKAPGKLFTVSEHQQRFIAHLRFQGYRAVVLTSLEAFQACVLEYLSDTPKEAAA